MNKNEILPYVANSLAPKRRETIQVRVGKALIGGNAPILVQSMTTTKPKDVEETVRQTLALAKAGCGLVRITVPTLADALALENVVSKIREAGCDIPLSADIHFQPKAAFEALKWVEKVRINPGNFVDSGIATLDNQTEESFESGCKKVREAFVPFLQEAKRLGRAIRIGVNHGSLSARMLYRYGDTVEGMVESALEYLSICEEENFDQVVVSLKASNPRIAVEAYRMLVAKLIEKGMKSYPLHVGVTEAGEGEDGRLKSAVGIGSLLLDGLGDTIRVSLTEDPVAEVPVAASLIQEAAPKGLNFPVNEKFEKDPYSYARRESVETTLGGVKIGQNHPVAVALPLPVVEGNRKAELVLSREDSSVLWLKDESDLAAFLSGAKNIEETTPICYMGESSAVSLRSIVAYLAKSEKKNPILLYVNKGLAENSKLRKAAELGSLLLDGIGDAVYAEALESPKEMLSLVYDILQAAGIRRSKTEFISCPGCGRTLYDIRSVLGEIKARLGHLQDVSIAVMGCIVNGPGEMSGADFGYVGGAPGHISLYEGLEPVKKNIPQEQALDELILLLKEKGRWQEPPTAN